MRVRVNDICLYFEVIGTMLSMPESDQEAEVVDRPSILLLHGGPGLDHSVFRPAFEPLAEKSQLIMYDHRGCGRSDNGPAEKWTIDQWAEDVAGVIEALNLDKPLVLGTSFGGFVAQRFARKYPELLSGLILMSTTPKPDVAMSLDKLLSLAGPGARDAAEKFFSDAAVSGVVENYFAVCTEHYTFHDVDLQAMARIKQNPDVMMHFFNRDGEMYQCDFREDLQHIQTPTLIVHGENDWVFPVQMADQAYQLLTQHNTQVKLVKIPECGHLSEQDAPDRIMAEIINFFAL